MPTGSGTGWTPPPATRVAAVAGRAGRRGTANSVAGAGRRRRASSVVGAGHRVQAMTEEVARRGVLRPAPPTPAQAEQADPVEAADAAAAEQGDPVEPVDLAASLGLPACSQRGARPVPPRSARAPGPCRSPRAPTDRGGGEAAAPAEGDPDSSRPHETSPTGHRHAAPVASMPSSTAATPADSGRRHRRRTAAEGSGGRPTDPDPVGEVD